MYEGQRIKMFRRVGEPDSFAGKERWVDAVIAYIPSHKEFIDFEFVFRNIFGETNTYRESFTIWELKKMKQKGRLLV